MQDPSLTSFVTPRNGHGEAHFPTASTSRNDNGNGPLPLSRRAFVRSLPRRVGGLEDQIEACELRLDAGDALLAKVEARLDAQGRALEHLVQRLDRLADL
jgi:hypothetical protein